MSSREKAAAKHKSARPAVLLLLALVFSLPTLGNVLSGSEPAVDVGVHLAGAVLVAWAAVAVVGHLFDNYRAAPLRQDQGGDGQPGES